MDKLGAMKTFMCIVESGSLTAAAEALDTSLPTVVRTLATLERHLGVRLLQRTTRRLHLTDEGAQYLMRCHNILSAVQEAEDTLLARRSEPMGRLSVTASALFGRRYVGPLLSDFLKRYAKVTGDVLFVDRLVNLADEGIDVGIRIAEVRDSSLVAIRVGRVRRVLCASPAYLKRNRMPRVPGDVREHACIRHLGLSPRNEWHFRIGGRRVTVPIEPVLTSNEIETSIGACVDGLGLGMFLSYMVAESKERGRLRYVLDKFESEPVPVQVVYPSGRPMTTRVRVFVDECVEKLRRVQFE